MTTYDLNTITPATTVTDGTTLMFGQEGQSGGTPQPYTTGGLKTWIKSWLFHSLGLVPYAMNSAMYLCVPATSYAAGALTANRLYMAPIIVTRSRAFTTYGLVLTTLNSTSGIRLGLYNADPNTFQPTTKLDEGTAPVDASTGTGSTGLKTVAFSANQTLAPGLYYLAVLSDVTPSVIRTAPNAGLPVLGALFGSAAISPNMAMYRDGVTYTTLPSDESAQSYSQISAAGTQTPVPGIR